MPIRTGHQSKNTRSQSLLAKWVRFANRSGEPKPHASNNKRSVPNRAMGSFRKSLRRAQTPRFQQQAIRSGPPNGFVSPPGSATPRVAEIGFVPSFHNFGITVRTQLARFDEAPAPPRRAPNPAAPKLASFRRFTPSAGAPPPARRNWLGFAERRLHPYAQRRPPKLASFRHITLNPAGFPHRDIRL